MFPSNIQKNIKIWKWKIIKVWKIISPAFSFQKSAHLPNSSWITWKTWKIKVKYQLWFPVLTQFFPVLDLQNSVKYCKNVKLCHNFDQNLEETFYLRKSCTILNFMRYYQKNLIFLELLTWAAKIGLNLSNYQILKMSISKSQQKIDSVRAKERAFFRPYTSLNSVSKFTIYDENFCHTSANIKKIEIFGKR